MSPRAELLAIDETILYIVVVATADMSLESYM